MATWVLNKLNRGVEVMFDRGSDEEEEEDESFSKCEGSTQMAVVYIPVHL